MNDATGTSHSDETDFTPGEVVLLTKIDQLYELVEELVEKVDNLNLSNNEGYSIDG